MADTKVQENNEVVKFRGKAEREQPTGIPPAKAPSFTKKATTLRKKALISDKQAAKLGM